MIAAWLESGNLIVGKELMDEGCRGKASKSSRGAVPLGYITGEGSLSRLPYIHDRKGKYLSLGFEAKVLLQSHRRLLWARAQVQFRTVSVRLSIFSPGWAAPILPAQSESRSPTEPVMKLTAKVMLCKISSILPMPGRIMILLQGTSTSLRVVPSQGSIYSIHLSGHSTSFILISLAK